MKRRTFVNNSVLSSFALLQANKLWANAHSPKKSILNIGIIGTGLRGQSHLELLCQRQDVTIVALADPDEMMMTDALKIIAKNKKNNPSIYKQGNDDYLTMLSKENLDAVIIASPWEFHISQAISCLKNGVIPGVEVCGANDVTECWKIVEESEKTNIPVMILENVCYRRDILAVHNMVKKGLFGELLHCTGGYQHDLRGVKFNDGKSPYGLGVKYGINGFSESKWRTLHSLKRNGDLYPTHGLGPIANLLDINKGNRLTKLSSVATKSKGLHNYIVNNPFGGKDCPEAQAKFKLGDIVTTQIQTANGETIVLTHDTNNPRPYHLGFRVQGTEGIWQDNYAGGFKDGLIYLSSIHKNHKWENSENLLSTYDHPLWKKYELLANGAGHGGMDFFVINAFIESIKKNAPFPFDVYDLATWYAITPLSEKSVAEGGTLQEIPDFTKGKWINRKNIFDLETQF